MKSQRIKIEAEIYTSIDKVWRNYSDSNHIVNWNFASDEWHCPFAKVDFKEGGKNISRMEAKDGSEGFDFEFTYTKIIKNELIEYTMLDGRRASVKFIPVENFVRLEIDFDPESINPIDL